MENVASWPPWPLSQLSGSSFIASHILLFLYYLQLIYTEIYIQMSGYI